ncbi:hypothetical protein GHT06_014033 [Daphnia sinensis]|uniref:Selenoprotein M n=1 Tax=Daphnia sinensis TaxID=1820382 RepID=A0AAD5PVV0_9CRUS|nr:hypothetical protein GHT06_014033 [Daphnia sinensis]
MRSPTLSFVASVFLLSCIAIADELQSTNVVKARIEVKKFIYEDVELFHNVLFKSIPGASPSILLLNEFDEIVEKVDISEFSREECNNFLLRRGFFKKSNTMDEVPEHLLNGPYFPKEDL